MCFSRPLLHSLRQISGRAFGIVVLVSGAEREKCSSSSSDDAESMLDESSGAGMSVAAACGVGIRIDERAFDRGSQQKVSLFQSRQLKFSSLFPSSTACDVLEKIDHCALC